MREILRGVAEELAKAERMIRKVKWAIEEVERQLVTVGAKLVVAEDMVAEEEEDEEEFEV